jgi:hypothetical protein
MKVEIREFRYAKHLLLITETDDEARAIDEVIGQYGPIDKPKNVSCELVYDDWFNPYIRFRQGVNNDRTGSRANSNEGSNARRTARVR